MNGAAGRSETVWPKRFRRLRIGPLDTMVDVRAFVVVATLAIVAVAVSAWATTIGDTPTGLVDVWTALTGGLDENVRRVILEWRMPRVVAALVAGAALGVSGAIFQSLTRNPLGSPDIIGFSTGSYTGALVGILIIGGSYAVTASGALIGGILTAVAVYALAYSRGVQGYRLIVIGIGVSAMLSAVNGYLIVNARLEEAMTAAAWGAGSLSDVTWTEVTPMVILIVVLLPVAFILARSLRLLEMGDDTAVALGVRAERVRQLMVLVGIALIASVTAVAGPIAFVALAAPQIARRVARTAGVTLPSAAAMGAVLLAVSDVLAATVIPDHPVPVGVVTVCIGGAYLIWLLLTQSRKA